MHIVECYLASVIDVLCLLGVEDVGIFDADVVYHSFSSMGYDSVLASAYIDVADVDVLEVGEIFLTC